MAKAHSPIRLDAKLMESAKLTGEVLKRSASEQVEFWASLGQMIANKLTAQDLIELKAGLVDIKLERSEPVSVNSDHLFQELNQKQQSGALQHAIQSHNIRYQMASDRQGYLEQVHPDGTRIVGKFIDGQFIPLV